MWCGVVRCVVWTSDGSGWCRSSVSVRSMLHLPIYTPTSNLITAHPRLVSSCVCVCSIVQGWRIMVCECVCVVPGRGHARRVWCPTPHLAMLSTHSTHIHPSPHSFRWCIRPLPSVLPAGGRCGGVWLVYCEGAAAGADRSIRPSWHRLCTTTSHPCRAPFRQCVVWSGRCRRWPALPSLCRWLVVVVWCRARTVGWPSTSVWLRSALTDPSSPLVRPPPHHGHPCPSGLPGY